MVKLKACPRCKTGDLGLDRDRYGWFWSCAQCGHLLEWADSK